MALLADFVNTGISLVSFLVLNICIILSAVLLTKKYFVVEGRLDNYITAGVLYIAQPVFSDNTVHVYKTLKTPPK